MSSKFNKDIRKLLLIYYTTFTIRQAKFKENIFQNFKDLVQFIGDLILK